MLFGSGTGDLGGRWKQEGIASVVEVGAGSVGGDPDAVRKGMEKGYGRVDEDGAGGDYDCRSGESSRVSVGGRIVARAGKDRIGLMRVLVVRLPFAGWVR